MKVGRIDYLACSGEIMEAREFDSLEEMQKEYDGYQYAVKKLLKERERVLAVLEEELNQRLVKAMMTI